MIRALVGDRIRTSPGSDWVEQLERAVREFALPTAEMQALVGDLAWAARTEGAVDIMRDVEDPSVVRVLVAAQILRFDFKFEELAAHCRIHAPRYPDNALLNALSAHADLALDDAHAARRLELALANPGLDRASRSVLLHGLWHCNALPDRSRRMHELADDIVLRHEDVPNTYFWRSAAYRSEGRYDEALAAINTALARHETGANSVHQDFVRERELIDTMRTLQDMFTGHRELVRAQIRDEIADALAEARAEIATKTAAAEDAVARSLSGVIEILGLFLAIIGFVAASGIVVFKADDFVQALLAVLLFLVGTISLFAALRAVTRFRPRSSRPSAPERSRPGLA